MADNSPAPETIFSQIQQEMNDFYRSWISVVPGYSFNQYQTIKRINLYLNSKYEDDSTFLGRNKIFFNIVIAPCEVAMRMLNIDTKDIRLWPMNPKSHFSTYLLEKELKLWLKKSKLGKILNQIAEEAPRFGSVILEKTKDGAKVVDLRRLINDPTVDSIQDSRFVTTIHYMTPTELRETGWDNTEEAIMAFANRNAPPSYEDRDGNLNQMISTPYIRVVKRYGEVPAWWLDESLTPGTIDGDKYTKSVFIVASPDFTYGNAPNNDSAQHDTQNGFILFKSKWTKEWPYKQFDYMKIKGRMLGVGIVEMLFDTQERINELKNQKRVSMEISSLHLFQTQDKSIVRNVLTDLESGDLLLAGKNGGITPIANEERNLPAFRDEEESYSQQVDRLSFAYEAVRGDTSGSTVPLGTTQIAVAQGTSVYAFKKENLALFLQEFFNDLVMPQLMKDLSPEHIMRFTGSVQELEKLDQAAAELYANDLVKEDLLNGKRIFPENYEEAKQKALDTYRKQGVNRFLKIKNAFYDDAEFEFDFLVTNEQADPAKMLTNIKELLVDAASNPAVLQDPLLKLLFFKMADQMGIGQSELELADQQRTTMMQDQASAVEKQAMAGALPPPQMPANLPPA